MKHQYPPLPLIIDHGDHHVRVLDLLPGRFNSELRLALRPESLSDSPHYEALSYTWGAAAEGRTVIVNDIYHLSVTDNLYRALRRLRYRFTRRTLWVDAICIDQTNYNERAAQVAIMGAIYRSASCVIIWLGEPTAASRMTWSSLQLARILYRQSRKRRGESIKTSLSVALKVVRNEHQALESALQTFISPWYERVWVIQETMGARRVKLRFGATAWGPKHPSQFIYGLGLQDSKYQLWTDSSSFNGIGRLLDRLKYRETAHGETGRPSPDQNPGIVQRIPLLRTATATDERDMVYSMLSLINDEEAGLMSVDYTLSVGEVYAIATYASIRASHAHTLLRGYDGKDDSRRKDLPSWALDFTNPKSLDRIKARRDSDPSLGVFRPPHPSRYALAELDETLTKIVIAGVTCGQIVGVQTLSPAQHTSTLIKWLYKSVTDHRTMAPLPAADVFRRRAYEVPMRRQKRREEGNWYLETAHMVLDRRQLMPYKVGSDLVYLFLLWDDLTHAIKNGQSPTLDRVRDGYLRDHSLSALDNSTPREAFVERSTLFALDNGLIGLASDSIEAGDRVVAMPCEDDSTSPFLVLHPDGKGSYTFRGLAYVHGCMHEDFWQGWSFLGDVEFESYVLR